MNTSAKSVKARKIIFVNLIPQTFAASTFFWFFLAFGSLLLSVGIHFLRPTVYSPLLPLLALSGCFFCLRYKIKGLLIFYGLIALFFAVFFASLAREERMWHLMAHVALALDFMIFLFAKEEIDFLFSENAKIWEEKEHFFEAQGNAFLKKESALNSLISDLEKTIQELKEEAEARRIEKQKNERRQELIHSEIELLTSQKDAFVQDFLTAQEKEQQSEKKAHELEIQSAHLRSQNSAFERSLSELKALLEKERVAKAAEIEAERRKYGEEKAKEFTAQNAHLKTQNATLEHSLEELKALLEKEKVAREAEIETAKHIPFLQSQESILMLQIKMQQAKTNIHNALEKQYSQLRMQFNEKSKILTQTRKDLFTAETKIMAFEKETTEQELERSEPLVEKELLRAMGLIKELEEEVTSLEALISHILVL